MSISLLIVDDHEVVRTGLKSMLSHSPITVVAEAGNVQDAVNLAQQHKPDVVLLDIRLGEEDGFLALESIKEHSPDARVLMLSTYDNPTYVARAVALGASDYVLKGSSREELIQSITQVARGEPSLNSGMMARIRTEMERRGDKAEKEEVPVTSRELQVLRHIALGLSNREIGRSLGISVETVKEHVQNILRKVNAVDRTQAAVWAVKKGLVRGVLE
jgi:DNA-binding NarL/FixJ family response regulator